MVMSKTRVVRGMGIVTGSQVPGQRRIFFHGWVKNGKPASAVNDEGGSGAGREMYGAVLTFASDGCTPIVGERL